MDEACVRAGSRRGLKVWDIPKKLSSCSVHGESLQTQQQRTTAGPPLCRSLSPAALTVLGGGGSVTSLSAKPVPSGSLLWP